MCVQNLTRSAASMVGLQSSDEPPSSLLIRHFLMIVFVHGVPETASIWTASAMSSAGSPLLCRSPGSAALRPDDFSATKDDYVDWLVMGVDRIDEPVDLVGHDWGAALTYRVATAHADKLRSWAADIANLVHPDYEWHAFAKLWQTPGEGEAFFESQNALSPEERARFRVGGRTTRRRARDGISVRRDDGRLHPRPLPLRLAERGPPLGAVDADVSAGARAAPD